MSSKFMESPAPRGWKRRGWWLGIGSVGCLLCWSLLAAGLIVGVERDALIVLVTIAAVATEGCSGSPPPCSG